MKNKKAPAVTLQAISRLIDRKFSTNNSLIYKRFDSIDGKILGIYGELDGIKKQISQLDDKVEAHRQETKEGFDTVFDGLDNINRILDKDHEPRIKRLEVKVFAQ